MSQYVFPSVVGSSLAWKPSNASGLANYTPLSNGRYDFAARSGVGNSLNFDFDADQFMQGLNTPSGGMTWQQGLGYGLAGLEALSGLMNAFIGYKNYRLSKKKFGFEKAAMNRNIANQAQVINNAYDNAAQVAAGMALDSSYGLARENLAKQYAADAEKKHVDGSKIG